VGTLRGVREGKKWDSNLVGTWRQTCRREGCNIVQKYWGIQKGTKRRKKTYLTDQVLISKK